METRVKPYGEPESGIGVTDNLEWEAGKVKETGVKCLYSALLKAMYPNHLLRILPLKVNEAI